MIERLTEHGTQWLHLRNETLSCLICQNRFGKLELVHLGAPVTIADGSALRFHAGTGWGDSLVLLEGDNSTSMDAWPLLWSDAGRGDHRDCPISLSRDGRALATDFVCVDAVLLPEPPKTQLPAGRGGETLRLRLRDAALGLTLELDLTLYATALGLRTALTLDGDADSVTIHRLMSACVDLFGEFTLESFHGGWAAEMQPCRTEVGAAMVVVGSRTGASSNQHQPGFLLYDRAADEDHGSAYVCNLIYSGNHHSSLQRSHQGLTRLLTGFQPLHTARRLESGQRFETPQAVLAYSCSGKNGASQAMHRFVSESVIPPYWQNRPRPVVYNSWEGCLFDFTEERLLGLAEKARALGCETFVLDDGWFGRRDDDTSSLGDYSVHKKLPHGLGWLSRRLRELGLDFGLWFEPEAVSPDSDLYRAHPDWAIRERETPILGRHELLLDLTKPEVRDYLVEQVGGVIDRADIRFVKWDMNRHSTALGAHSFDCVAGLYEVLYRIFDPRPHVLLEMCSSGGNRFDLGMLSFAPQIWCSDNTDPVCRLTIQDSLSRLYPQSCLSCHISASPNSQTLRDTPLETRGNVALFGVFGLELDLDRLTDSELETIRMIIGYYVQRRARFQFGSFRRLRAETGAVCWQVSDDSGSSIGLFHRMLPPAPPYERLYAAGLRSQTRYCIAARPQSLRTGPDGRLLRESTGAALMSGIALNPRFIGTGFVPDGRMQGDFGANVYDITALTE